MRAEMNERLKLWREAKGLTQAAVGELIGMKWYQVRDMEMGKVKVTLKIEKLLYTQTDINIPWFRTGEGSMNRQPVLTDEGGPGFRHPDPEIAEMLTKIEALWPHAGEDEKNLLFGTVLRLYNRVISRGEIDQTEVQGEEGPEGKDVRKSA